MKFKKKIPFAAFLAALAVFTFILNTGLIAETETTEKYPVADVVFSGSSVSFLPKIDHSALTLKITGPGDFSFYKTFNGGAAPFFSLSDNSTPFIDGTYRYELQAIPNMVLKIRKESDMLGNTTSKPGNGNLQMMGPMVQSGTFMVLNDTIVTPGNFPEPQRANDVLYLDDVIVDGSICVGFDCVDGEAFGFDTMRLKENNLRIHFDDTSVAASYPRTDWRIVINDSSNGGASYFGVEDASAGRRVFTLEANAPSHSLYVDDRGRLGLGTSTPSLEIHAKDGDTPALRLEQDGSSGFSPQSWDVAGNETSFFIRDVTNGSTLPFRIFPSAPSNSLNVGPDGDVGVGTISPDFSLEVERTGEGALIVANRTDGAQIELTAAGNFGIIGTRTNHPVKFRVNTADIMQLNGSGNYIDMQVGGGYYNGNWVNGSSRKLKENIEELSAADAQKALEELEPVRYNYKHNSKEEHLGFIAEDVPEIVAMNDRRGLAGMDFIAVLTRVVKEQQKSLKRYEQAIEKLRNQVDKLKKLTEK